MSHEPHIGIFFIVGDSIYQKSDKVGNIKADPFGFVDIQTSHYEYWDVVCFFAPEHKKHDFDYYPRGRVIYNALDDAFFVWLDKCIDDYEHRDLICESFNLSGKNVIYDNDEHYSCANCNENYVDIAGEDKDRLVIEVMSREKARKFSFSSYNKKIAVISISDCDKSSPNLNNNPKNGIAFQCKLHFDDVESGKENCITKKDAEKIIAFVNDIKDKTNLLIVHCEAGISRSAGVASAIMKFLYNDDTPIFNSPMFCPNMTCYRKVLNAFYAIT